VVAVSLVCYVTEEQLEDAPATSMIVEQAFSSELRFAKEREVWEGNGTGEMLGWMNSGALVTQAAEAGQTAGTIVAPNITKMWARLHPSARANAVWYINQDAEPQLPLMTIGNWPVYVPPTGLSGSRYGTLYNRPVVAVEFASTIGQVGDIVLADPSFFALGVKGGAKMQRSIHVRFIQGEETFRFTERCDGQPMLAAPITPFKGSNTQSAFVALAAR
jgi:HK97 family phage major capsid protein